MGIRLKGFVTAMKYKLYVHSNKGSFDWKTDEMLLDQLSEEVEELRKAVKDGKKEAIIAEAADVANFAYFIADKASRGIK